MPVLIVDHQLNDFDEWIAVFKENPAFGWVLEAVARFRRSKPSLCHSGIF
jgi:hypothetical protein